MEREIVTKEKQVKYFNNKGFSLVELIIVIAIMAILASAIGASVIRYIRKARVARARDEAAAIVRSVEVALASDAGNEANKTYTSTYIDPNGVSHPCRIITNWILAKTQRGDTITETDSFYAEYVASVEILKNICSSEENTPKFLNFNGSVANPIGASCSVFDSQYHCPGLIVVYDDSCKVVFLEYYNYGVLVRFENGKYEDVEATNFTGTDRLQYN